MNMVLTFRTCNIGSSFVILNMWPIIKKYDADPPLQIIAWVTALDLYKFWYMESPSLKTRMWDLYLKI